jgi:Snare region anchored in the vesicle membrane C-terminus
MTDTSAAAAFDNYAEEFRILLNEIQTLTSNNANCDTSLQSDQAMIMFQQCHDLLQQMAIEARSTDSLEQRKQYMERYQAYKNLYHINKQLYERHALLSTANNASGNLSPHVLRSTEQTIVRQNTIVANSLKSIHETEQVAIETMEHLHNQRDTLERSNNNTKSLQSLTQQANQIATNLLKPWWRKGV